MKLRNMASVYISCGEEMLLLYRKGSRVVNECWVASAGGHFEQSELNSPLDCVKREMREELGLEPDVLKDMHLRYICLRRKNGEIRQNYYFFAETDNKKCIAESNEGTLEWVPYPELLSRAMPFTARGVIKHYLESGRKNDDLYAGVSTPEGTFFSLLEEFEGE